MTRFLLLTATAFFGVMTIATLVQTSGDRAEARAQATAAQIDTTSLTLGAGDLPALSADMF